ncbi:S-formylglutathione hydrolase [Temperatibacter marinus]|uniref:S-formylglutathione hydrolase n=1 Tax=Temperatibacter marinus TaxID=1456591 RepID=A0AA52EL28_9PROT|nr:S-formylglutathione hydrolase [Temperatibacter marinus]WND03986.1 S-formylglutathione hydrolase [Temperatibacter marinus]
MTLTTVSEIYAFEGIQGVYKHASDVTNCEMEFSVYVPSSAALEMAPVVWYLSGLTCTQDNATTKAGFQRTASELGLVIICPDTSPRGETVPDDPEGAYDLGLGAGFYLDATEEPWSSHYQMYSYITQELPALVAEHFPVDLGRQAIMGHSMGGHGALTLWRKNPELYKSVSAFSPICHPIDAPWGQKALNNYLGTDVGEWSNHDACALLLNHGPIEGVQILVDQGMGDQFIEEQLKPDQLELACGMVGQDLLLRRQMDYDHSYYFIATFIEDHLRHHAQALANL